MCLLVSPTVLWLRMWGLCVGGVDPGVCLGLGVRSVLARVPPTRAWTGVPRVACSPSLK